MLAGLNRGKERLDDPSSRAGIPAIDEGLPPEIERFDKRIIRQAAQCDHMWGAQLLEGSRRRFDGRDYTVLRLDRIGDSLRSAIMGPVGRDEERDSGPAI